MDTKSEQKEYNSPHPQYGYQQFPGSSGRPYPSYPYYPGGQQWGHQNYYDQNQYMMYPGYGHQSKSSSLPLTSVQTFFTPEGTLNLDNTDYPFKNKFPRLKNYENEDEIREAFKTTLDNVNDESFDPEAAKNGAFFILRSTNDENIHKSIKYGIWTSSAANNETLTQAFKACRESDAPVYLIFSVAKSGHFIGIAQMLSEFNAGMSFKYWCEGNKWFGSFKVKWIFVKDVDDTALMHIKQSGIPINKMKDCSEISEKNGKEVLQIFRDYEAENSFFDCFAFLDQREDECRFLRDNDTEFLKNFMDMSKKFVDTVEKKKQYNKGAEPYMARKYERGVNEEHVPENLEERFIITKKTPNNKKEKGSKKKGKKLPKKKYEYFRKESQEENPVEKNKEFFKNYDEADEKEVEIEKIENKLEEKDEKVQDETEKSK